MAPGVALTRSGPQKQAIARLRSPTFTSDLLTTVVTTVGLSGSHRGHIKGLTPGQRIHSRAQQTRCEGAAAAVQAVTGGVVRLLRVATALASLKPWNRWRNCKSSSTKLPPRSRAFASACVALNMSWLRRAAGMARIGATASRSCEPPSMERPQQFKISGSSGTRFYVAMIPRSEKSSKPARRSSGSKRLSAMPPRQSWMCE
mmetsp:Transcript_7106/g.16859  ORF Transcript_7106/g.16859 Transcript_7106/m.16859 type:complete len:202 (+) Transcript_7106:98-703(+)